LPINLGYTGGLRNGEVLTCGVEELNDIKVASVGGQPEGGVPLLVPHIHLGSTGQQQLHKPVTITSYIIERLDQVNQ